MAASQLHASVSAGLSFCARHSQNTAREKIGAPSSLPSRPARFSVSATSIGPLHTMTASTLETQVDIIEREDVTPAATLSSVEICTLRNCKLGIAMYPDFTYNAEGGGGLGTAEELPDGKLSVDFDIERLYIPAVEWKTTKFLGLPLPPFLCIRVLPKCLKSIIDRTSGKVKLEFSADFLFSVGSLYRPPPLIVHTLLTTETTGGRVRRGQGRRLNSEGKCRLVGVAPLAPIEDAFMNAFLTLPTDCLDVMEAQFNFAS